MIQTGVVRLHLLLITVSASLAACAHTREEVHTTTVSGEAVPSMIEDREVVAIDSPPPPEPAPVSRPRLSRTITLGEGTEAQYTPSAPRPSAPQGPTVVVNNNVVVQNSTQWYGGYSGYGGYRGYGGYGRPTTFTDGSRWGGSGGGARPQWGATGWEGAGRTAAPGQTPGVGGNWAPVPSYGPAQMK